MDLLIHNKSKNVDTEFKKKKIKKWGTITKSIFGKSL